MNLTEEQLLELCCAVASAADRSYLISIGQDPSIPWNELGPTMRAALTENAKRAINGGSERENHASWRRARELTGWKYAPVTDRANRLHASLVDYADLPRSEQLRGRLFANTVRAVYFAFEPQRRGQLHQDVLRTVALYGTNPDNVLHEMTYALVNYAQEHDKLQELQEHLVRACTARGLTFSTEMPTRAHGLLDVPGVTDMAQRESTILIERGAHPGRVYGASLGKFKLLTNPDEPSRDGTCVISKDEPHTLHLFTKGTMLKIGRVRLGTPKLIESVDGPPRMIGTADPDYAIFEQYKLHVIYGIQRFGMGWRVMGPSHRVICDIEAGDNLAELLGAEIEEPRPTGEEPKDRRAELDAELAQSGEEVIKDWTKLRPNRATLITPETLFSGTQPGCAISFFQGRPYLCLRMIENGDLRVLGVVRIGSPQPYAVGVISKVPVVGIRSDGEIYQHEIKRQHPEVFGLGQARLSEYTSPPEPNLWYVTNGSNVCVFEIDDPSELLQGTMTASFLREEGENNGN